MEDWERRRLSILWFTGITLGWMILCYIAWVASGCKPFMPYISDFDLFKGYAFIKIKTYDQIKTINSTLGVNKVLRVEDKIPQVSEDIIKMIKRQIKEFNLDAKLLFNIFNGRLPGMLFLEGREIARGKNKLPFPC